MNFLKSLKNLQTLETQLSTLPKLYRSHTWITPPDADGLSFFGISDFAKKYFMRLSRINAEGFLKTNYGIANRELIKIFIQQTKDRKEKGQLLLSEKMEWERFYIKQGEVFANLQTIEFDVTMEAPVDMRLVQINFDVDYHHNLLTAPYFYRAEILNLAQLPDLMKEQEYLASKKIIMM